MGMQPNLNTLSATKIVQKWGGGICEHHVMVALPDYKGFFLKFIY